MTDVSFRKFAVAVNVAVPLAVLGFEACRHELGVNAVNYAIHTTGLLSLTFLILSLLVTPLRRIFHWAEPLNHRRTLGLAAFFYACIHFAIYVVWDRALSLSSTVHEILGRVYLQIGTAGLLLMLPLALTSTNGMMRRLGAVKWKALHRLAYLAAIAGAVHYYLQQKSDKRQALWYAGVLAAALLFRFVWHYVELRRAAKHAVVPAVAPRPKFWRGELIVAKTFDETPSVRTFRLTTVDGRSLPFEFQPGQYLNLELTVDGKPVRRSYTIASSPTRPAYCELTVKREEMGVSSAFLHRSLRAGDKLKIAAPAGKFTFTGDGETGVVLIGGGVGITPLMSIVRSLCDRTWPGEIDLLVVTRTPADIIFREELTLLSHRHPNLHVTVALTGNNLPADWAGERGRLSLDMLNRLIPQLKQRPIYLCGPDEMMAATRELLRSAGVDESHVHQEAFVSPPSPAAGASAVADTGVAVQAAVNFVKSNVMTDMSPEQTLLEVGEASGVAIPFECRSGICGQCKTRLLSGTVAMSVQDALGAAEKSAGWILACQAHATSDLTVDA